MSRAMWIGSVALVLAACSSGKNEAGSAGEKVVEYEFCYNVGLYQCSLRIECPAAQGGAGDDGSSGLSQDQWRAWRDQCVEGIVRQCCSQREGCAERASELTQADVKACTSAIDRSFSCAEQSWPAECKRLGLAKAAASAPKPADAPGDSGEGADATRAAKLADAVCACTSTKCVAAAASDLAALQAGAGDQAAAMADAIARADACIDRLYAEGLTADLAKLTDKGCACKDQACFEGVQGELLKRIASEPEPPKRVQAGIMEVMERLGSCGKKIEVPRK